MEVPHKTEKSGGWQAAGCTILHCYLIVGDSFSFMHSYLAIFSVSESLWTLNLAFIVNGTGRHPQCDGNSRDVKKPRNGGRSARHLRLKRKKKKKEEKTLPRLSKRRLKVAYLRRIGQWFVENKEAILISRYVPLCCNQKHPLNTEFIVVEESGKRICIVGI